MTLNGVPADSALTQRIVSAAAARPAAAAPHPDLVQAALALRDADDERRFDQRYLALLHATNGVATGNLRIPGRERGVVAGLLYPLRKLLWSLLRFAFDDLAWRQNTVNRALTHALEWHRHDVEDPPH